MSNNVKIEMNDAGVKELLKSPNIITICSEMADAIKMNYGGDGEVTTSTKSTRGYASVSSTSATNELLIAMGKAKKVK